MKNGRQEDAMKVVTQNQKPVKLHVLLSTDVRELYFNVALGLIFFFFLSFTINFKQCSELTI